MEGSTSMVALYIAFSALTLFTSITETVGTNDFNIVAIGRNVWNGISSETISKHGACPSPRLRPLPVGVTDPASVFFQDHLMLCGGMDAGNDWSSSCYGLESNAFNATWKTLPPLNIARSDFTITKAGDEIYAVGGIGEGFKILDSIEKNSGEGWELMNTKLPRALSQHCTLHLRSNNSLVVIGGGGKVDSLDLSTLEWSSLPPLPVDDLQGFGCAAVEEAGEGKILVTGGWRPWPKPRSQSKCYGWPADGQFQSQVYFYNGASWRQTGQLTGPRSYHAMAVLGGRPLVLGGDDGDFEQCQKIRVLRVERMAEGRNWENLPAHLIKKLPGGGPAIYTIATVPAHKFPCFD